MNHLQRVKQILVEYDEHRDRDKAVNEIDAIYSEEHSPASEHLKHILGMRDIIERRK